MGDQDWVTLLSWKKPAFFFELPCAFNYIIGITMVNTSFSFEKVGKNRGVIGYFSLLWIKPAVGPNCLNVSLQEDRKEVDLGSEAECKSPKIVHRTSSLDNSIQYRKEGRK